MALCCMMYLTLHSVDDAADAVVDDADDEDANDDDAAAMAFEK